MKYELAQFWPEGAPPCAVCGGTMDTTEWSATGTTIDEYRENRPETAHHLRRDATDGSRGGSLGWLPLCSDDCNRLLYPEEYRWERFRIAKGARAQIRKLVRRHGISVRGVIALGKLSQR